MNEVINNILSRRSVRAYSEKQIKQEDLDAILSSGYNAPSACNSQSWHFTVIQDKELINTLSVEAKKEIVDSENELFRQMANNESYNIFYHAPTIIVISGEENTYSPLVDCSAATQNMLLAAESLGIGTCWIGLITFLFESAKAQEYIKTLKIPQGYKPYYAITLGYKKFPDPKAKPRRESVVTYIR